MINFKDAIELTEVGSYVDIKISGKEFRVHIGECEVSDELEKKSCITEKQYHTVDVIIALRKLANSLESSLGNEVYEDANE